MKEILFYLKVIGWMVFAVVFFYVACLAFYFYAFTHLPPASAFNLDTKKHPPGSVFLYSKKFANLTGLDPAQAKELPEGLEAIEFYAGPEKTPTPLLPEKYGVDSNSIEIIENNSFIKESSPLESLFFNHVKTHGKSCEFKLYLDDSIPLLLPKNNKNYLWELKYNIENINYGFFPYLLDNTSIKKEFDALEKKKNYQTRHSDYSFEDDIIFKSFMIQGYASEWIIKQEEQKIKKAFFAVQQSFKIKNRAYSLDYLGYQQNFMPNINYINVGELYGCSILNNVEDNPYLFLELKNGDDYRAKPSNPIWTGANDLNLKDFYYFKIPIEIIRSSVYQDYQHLEF